MVQIIGRIYRIVSSECDGCYIGSTTRQLSIRFSCHQSTYKRYLAGKSNYVTSFKVIKFADANIELIHEGVFDSKEDMKALEDDIIRTTPNAVNKNIAVWTGTKQEYDTKYYQDNRETIRARKDRHITCPICGGKFTPSHKHQHAVSSASSVIDSSNEDSDFS